MPTTNDGSEARLSIETWSPESRRVSRRNAETVPTTSASGKMIARAIARMIAVRFNRNPIKSETGCRLAIETPKSSLTAPEIQSP